MEKWLGEVCHKVLSLGFSSFSSDAMIEDQVKVYCSEMILLGILKFMKQNPLSEEEVENLNKKMLP